MSNEKEKPGAQPQQAAQPQKKEKTPTETQAKIFDILKRVALAFFRGNRTISDFVSQGYLWDIQKTPSGLTMCVYNMGTCEMKNFAVPVGGHPTHLPSADADSLLELWDKMRASGALRSVKEGGAK